MKFNPLLISLLLFACIDAIAVPLKILMKSAAGSGDGAADIRIQQAADGTQLIDEVNAGNSVNDANQQISVPYNNLPQILAPKMRERSFKDAYELSRLWKSDDASPLDRQELNPLALHDANLDNQYALKQWARMRPGTKKSAVLFKLIENPTVDFKELDLWTRRNAFREIINWGDLDYFKTFYDRRQLKPNDRLNSELVQVAAEKNDLNIIRYLLDDKKVDISHPGDSAKIQSVAAKYGDKELMRYLLEEYTHPDGRKLDLYPTIQLDAANSGNRPVIDYLFEEYDGARPRMDPDILSSSIVSRDKNFVEYIFSKYKALYEEDLPIRPQIQSLAVQTGDLNLVKYIFDKYEQSHSQKIEIRPDTQKIAAESGNLEVLRYLIDDQGAAIEYDHIMHGVRYIYKPIARLPFLQYLYLEKGLPIPNDRSHFSLVEQHYLQFLQMQRTNLK